MIRPSLSLLPIDRISRLTLLALVLAALGLAPAQAVAASQADEDACRPDVFRLCMTAIPDENAIVSCLNDHLQALSPACHAVIDPSWRPTSHAPRRRLSTR